jgi:hypothetical protein
MRKERGVVEEKKQREDYGGSDGNSVSGRRNSAVLQEVSQAMQAGPSGKDERVKT